MRTIFRSKYTVSMFVLGALTGVLALPGMALSIGNITYGIGLLLSPVILSLFFYGLCFLPVALFGGRARDVAWVLVMAIVFVPGFFAHIQHKRMLARISAADISATPEQAPKVLDLVGDLTRLHTSSKTNKECNVVCQNSLQSGAVEVVRVFDPEALSGDENSIAYRLDGTGAIVFTNDERPAELTLALNFLKKPSEIKEEYGFSEPLGVDLKILIQLRATKGGYFERETAELVWQQTGYRTRRIHAPTIFSPNIVGFKSLRNPGGIKVYSKHSSDFPSVDNATEDLKLYSRSEASRLSRERWDQSNNRENAAALLRSVYGSKAVVPPNSASPSAARDWARLLDRPRHLQQRGPVKLSKADRAMVRNMYITGDKRLWDPIITAIIADEALLNEFLPQVFDSAYENLEVAQFAKKLLLEIRHSNLSQEELSPFTPQLRSLMEQKIMNGENLYSFYLLPLANRFGIDLRPFLKNLSFEVLKTTHRNWTSHMCSFPLRDLDDLGSVLQERLREGDHLAVRRIDRPVFVDRHDHETRCRVYQ